MHSANDVFLQMGEFTALGTGGNPPSHGVVIPDDGEIIGCVLHAVAGIDVQTTIDILKNGSDTNVDFVIPILIGANEGRFCNAAATIPVVEGDFIDLTSNGECGATAAAICLILRR